MSLFDSIISEAGERFGLGDKSGTLLAGLLGLMTDKKNGGFTGFLDRFSEAGLGDTVASWISSGANEDLSEEQLESALGSETVTDLANQADVNASTAKSALAFMIPQVIDKLTPDGEVPAEKDLLSRIGDFLSGIGGAVTGAALGAAGAVGDAGKAVVGKGVAVAGKGVDMVGDAAGATLDAGKATAGAVGGALGSVGDVFGGDSDGDSKGFLNWLLPLVLLGLLLILGYMFCGKGNVPVAPAGNANANANKASNANANTTANAPTSNASSNTSAGERALTEVMLPNGTKLQAYPGGIEDQLVKFIQSDEYKNGTEETLKNRWFNFDDLNFVFGKTELDAKSKRQLDNIKEILKAFPDVKIKIGAYSDKKGDDNANLKLSDNRAKAVKAALEKEGVGAQVPQAEGYGEKFATVAETASDDERAVDRKTAIRLLKGDAASKPAEANANAAKPATANTANTANAKPANANH